MVEKQIDKDILLVLATNVEKLNSEEITFESKLEELGVNSINFIKIVVELERKFDIEFNDEDLTYERFKTVSDIIRYVKEQMEFI